MILKLLLDTEMIQMIFTKILKNLIQMINVRILTVFNDLIVDMPSNKNLHPTVTELFTRGRQLNISLIFIKQSYFAVPKNIRLNYLHYFIMKILSNQELQQITFSCSSDIDFRDFMNFYKKMYFYKPFSFLVIDAFLASDNLYVSERIF